MMAISPDVPERGEKTKAESNLPTCASAIASTCAPPATGACGFPPAAARPRPASRKPACSMSRACSWSNRTARSTAPPSRPCRSHGRNSPICWRRSISSPRRTIGPRRRREPGAGGGVTPPSTGRPAPLALPAARVFGSGIMTPAERRQPIRARPARLLCRSRRRRAGRRRSHRPLYGRRSSPRRSRPRRPAAQPTPRTSANVAPPPRAAAAAAPPAPEEAVMAAREAAKNAKTLDELRACSIISKAAR